MKTYQQLLRHLHSLPNDKDQLLWAAANLISPFPADRETSRPEGWDEAIYSDMLRLNKEERAIICREMILICYMALKREKRLSETTTNTNL